MEESAASVLSFLLRYPVLEETETPGTYTLNKPELDCVFEKIEKVTTEAEDVPVKSYTVGLVRGEPLEQQVIRQIALAGDAGASSLQICSELGIHTLIFRYSVKGLLAEGLIRTGMKTVAKTSMLCYFLADPKKVLSNMAGRRGADQPEMGMSKLTHLPSNIERMEVIYRVFQKHKLVSRPELRKLIRVDSGDDKFANIDSKTLTRLFTSFLKEGKLRKLIVKGSGDSLNGKSVEVYHLPSCSPEEIQAKVGLLTKSINRGVVTSEVGSYHMFLSQFYKRLKDPLPDSIISEESFTTQGVYHGTKTEFIQKFHLVLSVLIRRWPLSPAIHPDIMLELRDWWEYVLTIDPPKLQEDGTYEAIELVNLLPANFLVDYLTIRGTEFHNFKSFMESNDKHKFCVGQLPEKLIISVGHNIIHVLNGLGKVIELCGHVDLLKSGDKFDFSRKMILNFKFKLNDRLLLLDTKDSPIHRKVCRGYNIRRIDKRKKILVFDCTDVAGYMKYWCDAKDICLTGQINDTLSFSKNITYPARSLMQVLEVNGIATDQEESFYSSQGTLERLDCVYSELGPAGFQIRLFMNKRDNWLLKASFKQRGFMPETCLNNITRPQNNSSQNTKLTDEESDSDDYATEKVKQKRERMVPVKRFKRQISKDSSGSTEGKLNIKIKRAPMSIPRPSRKRKRPTTISDLTKRNKTTKKKKYHDEIDVNIISERIFERVKFAEEEDYFILKWSACLQTCGEPHNPTDTRNLMHASCPDLSADKTVESIKKRKSLLLDRPESMSRIIDMQVKAMAFRNIATPKIRTARELFDRQDEWLGDHFVIRNILPTSKTDLMATFTVECPSNESLHHLTVFLTEGYRNKTVRSFKTSRVNSIWSNPAITDTQRHIYRLLMLTVSNRDAAHNETSHRMLKALPSNRCSEMSEYMYKHQVIRKLKRQYGARGELLERQKVGVAAEAKQCLYSPFPDELLNSSDPELMESLFEIHYSELSPNLLITIFQGFWREEKKVIISGAIDPFIDCKKTDVKFQDAESEDAMFTKIHTKKNTFFSGISSLEEGSSLGFHLSEKHIAGRPSSKISNHSEEEKPDGYEDLLGFKDSSWPIPLKLFFSPNKPSQNIRWDHLNLDSGTLDQISKTDDKQISSVTSLSPYSLTVACNKALAGAKDDGSVLKMFSHFCELNKGTSYNLVDPGKKFLMLVLDSRDTGIVKSSLWNTLLPSASSDELSEILQICLNLELVLEVGYGETILIAKDHAVDWMLTLQPSAAIGDEHATKEEDDLEAYFPVTAKSWRKVNTDLDLPLIKDLTKSLVLFIYAFPGVCKQLIDKRYHAFLSPVESKQVLETLLISDILKRDMDTPAPASVFSPSFPQIRLDKEITCKSCFSVTEEGLSNFHNFFGQSDIDNDCDDKP